MTKNRSKSLSYIWKFSKKKFVCFYLLQIGFSFFAKLFPFHLNILGFLDNQGRAAKPLFSPLTPPSSWQKQCFRIFFSSAAPNLKMSFERHYFTASSGIGRFWLFPGCSCIVCFFLQFLCYIIISLSCLSLKNRYPREPSSPWFP